MARVNDALELIKQLKTMSSDPMTAMKLAAANNPQVKMVLELIEKSGGNPRIAAEQLMKINGVDIRQLQSMFNAH